MPDNQSIWIRPLGRKFWMWSGSICFILFLCFVTYPFASSTFTWLGHRSVAYRGANIPLPFRWVYDKSGIPLTIEKPSSLLLINSSLFISKSSPDSDAKKRLDTFAKLGIYSHAKYPAGTAPHAFTYSSGQMLFCSEDPTSKFITIQCMSQDGIWLFNYLGNAEDAHEVNAAVQYILAHEGDFR